jgi:hypothetical protein
VVQYVISNITTMGGNEMISKRTLERWRLEALRSKNNAQISNIDSPLSVKETIETQDRILRLTQELLDQQLLKK